MLKIVIALVLIFSLSGTALAAKTIRVSLCNSETHPQSIGLQLFKQIVEEQTKGELKVNLYYNSQLGGERESVEQVKNGLLEMATASAGPMTTFNPRFMVLDIPYAFNDYNEAWMVTDGPAGQALFKSCEEIGLKGLGWYENGFRHTTNSSKPVKTIDDFKGLKIRTMEAPMHMEAFKLLGANPTPVPWTELYLVMQQRVVDGQENPLANIWEVKMYEVQKFVSLDGHIYDPMPLVANLDWFNGLTKEEQKIIETAGLLGQSYSRAVNSAREEYIVGLLEGKGMEVNAVSEAEKDKMREATQSKIVQMIKEKTDPKFVDQWLSSIEQARKDIKAGL
ncbi:MAG: TRAP transporter substrate-binding protein [Synergistaceae bacterium]|jgi:tripartite ATP-independent transporter DctP family solute receptor|nr:TRAP transporter substrate-binding protein [Synergistaceae bacterium]MDD4613002.1 TRAP transporter substrate-binding protein [Synergistaceae bacterium]NLO58985.1 TRAP transporter substrate-binding protein [Synergistaceae bacterium]